MEVKPIIKKRVYQEIITQFVEMLSEDRIKAGDKLPSERTLAEMFRVSRPSVREALRVMETIGVIETRAGGGAFVTDLNLAPFINIFAPLIARREGFEMELLDLRELLEIKAAGLTAVYAKSAVIEVLGKIVKEMYKSLELKDTETGAVCDIQFHKTIFESCNNYILMRAADYVNSLIEISIKGNRALLLRDNKNAVKLCSEHEAIFEAIKQKNSILAEECMSKHIKRVRVLYQKNL